MLHLLEEQQRELQLNSKTNNNQSCQKIKMYLSNNQGFKEATFIQTGMRARDVEMGREARRRSAVWRGNGGRKSGPTFMYSG